VTDDIREQLTKYLTDADSIEEQAIELRGSYELLTAVLTPS
jgi:hypothetical protein